MSEPSRRGDEMSIEALRAEVERLRTMRQLVLQAIKPSLDAANAFGGEMSLALRVREVVDGSWRT